MLLNIEMQRACETAAKNQNQREEKFFSNQIFDLWILSLWNFIYNLALKKVKLLDIFVFTYTHGTL